MKRIFSILFALALALSFSLVAVPAAANGPPVHNINTGENFATIQAAIDDPETLNGHTISVDAGTYFVDAESWDGSRCVHINKNLHLKGAGSGLTVLDAQHTYSVLLPPGPNQLHCTVIWNSAQTVTIEGLTVKRGDWGIRSNAGAAQTSLTLIDVVVDDNYGIGIVFENNIGTATFTNVVAKHSGDFGIYFSPSTTATTVTLTNTSANNNGHAGFSCQGSIANLSISGGTFNNNSGGMFQSDYSTPLGPYYGFGIELWNCVGSITGVTAAGNGFGGPDVVPLLYGLEGGAGIVVKDGSKLANNISITGSNLQNNMNGLWIEDPDSVANWAACLAGSVAVHLSNIAGNTEYGVLNCCSTPITMSATCNWWGDASGPYHPTLNPGGTGDEVSDNVDFAPWLGAPLELPAVHHESLGAGADQVVDASDEADTIVTLTTTGDTEIYVARYESQPFPDEEFPDEALGKYIDIHVSNPENVIWPIHVEVSYTDAEVAAAGIDESTLGLYYYESVNTFHRCSDTGVNTAANFIWANVSQEEAGYLMGTAFGVGGSPPALPRVPMVNQYGIVAMITVFAGLLVWTVRRRRLAS